MSLFLFPIVYYVSLLIKFTIVKKKKSIINLQRRKVSCQLSPSFTDFFLHVFLYYGEPSGAISQVLCEGNPGN